MMIKILLWLLFVMGVAAIVATFLPIIFLGLMFWTEVINFQTASFTGFAEGYLLAWGVVLGLTALVGVAIKVVEVLERTVPKS